MPDRKAVEVEVLPPARHESSKVHCGGLLQDIGNQIHNEFEAFGKLEKEATFHALRIGLLLLRVKEQLKHGELEPWIEKYVTEVRRSQAFNFMRLARIFIEKNQLDQKQVFLLCEAKTESTAKAEPKVHKVVQLVFDFIQDKSLNDLFDEYGIKNRKPVGGANHLHSFLKKNYPGHPEYLNLTLRDLPKDIKTAWEKHLREAKDPNDDTEEFLATDTWNRLIRELREECLEKKSYALLSRAMMEEIHGTLIDVKRALKEALDK